MIIEIEEKEFEEKIKETCIIDFFATWCPPCKILLPVIEKVSEEYKDRLNFYKINIDESPNIAEKYGVLYIPTLILFKNGEKLNEASGVMGEEKLIEFIKKVI